MRQNRGCLLPTWQTHSTKGAAGAMRASTNWRKSSYSQDGGTDCVEVAFAEREAAVRDSKNVAGPALALPPASWRHFVAVLSETVGGRS